VSCQSPVSGPSTFRVMKAKKRPARSAHSRPEKVLLHMARTEEDWAGVAICFDGQEPHRFRSLKDLSAWLSSLCKKK
jgi:hypothetical protein